MLPTKQFPSWPICYQRHLLKKDASATSRHWQHSRYWVLSLQFSKLLYQLCWANWMWYAKTVKFTLHLYIWYGLLIVSSQKMNIQLMRARSWIHCWMFWKPSQTKSTLMLQHAWILLYLNWFLVLSRHPWTAQTSKLSCKTMCWSKSL